MRYVSIPTAAEPPADMISADTTVDEVRYVLLTNNVVRALDAETGLEIANYRYPNTARAQAGFAALVAAAQ